MPNLLTGITGLLYFVATFGFIAGFLFRRPGFFRWAFRAGILGVVVQTLLILTHLKIDYAGYLSAMAGAYQIISWFVVGAFLLISRFRRIRLAGTLFFPVAIALMIAAAYHNPDFLSAKIAAEKATFQWLAIHLWFALLAFAIFLTSFLIGLLFIWVERDLKQKRLSRITLRLPSLEVLDAMHYKALGVGLLFLTASIVAGLMLNHAARGLFFTWDAKQLWVLATWFIYAAVFSLRLRAWRGRRGIFLSGTGFITVMLVFIRIFHGG